MTLTVPFRPAKGQTFRVYLSNEGVTTQFGGGNEITTIWRSTNFGNLTWKITKDGGSPVDLTNAPVNPHGNQVYIDLTADEMNADAIMITGSYTELAGNADDRGMLASVIIYTSNEGSGSGSDTYSPAVLTVVLDAIEKGYNVKDISVNDGDYNYYGLFQNKGAKPYLIIREKTDFTEVKYFQSNNQRQLYSEAWNQRVSLSYSSSVTLF